MHRPRQVTKWWTLPRINAGNVTISVLLEGKMHTKSQTFLQVSLLSLIHQHNNNIKKVISLTLCQNMTYAVFVNSLH